MTLNPKPTPRNIAISLGVAIVGIVGFYAWFFALIAAKNTHPYAFIAYLAVTAAAVGAVLGYGETDPIDPADTSTETA